MVRTLVTGAAGFVGSHICKRLLDEGHDVIALVRDIPIESGLDRLGIGDDVGYAHLDITDGSDFLFTRILRQYRPDFLIHLAAHAIVSDAFKEPSYTFMNNFGLAVNIMESLRSVKGDIPVKTVVLSTDKVMNEVSDAPYLESDRILPWGMGPYESSKLAADIAISSYIAAYGLDVLTIRSCNIYGPGDINASRIIPKIAKQIASTGELRLLRGSDVSREYIHVDDVGAAFSSAMAMFDDLKGSAWHIGSGDRKTVPDIVTTFSDVMQREGSSLKVTWEEKPMPFAEIRHQAIDSTAFRMVTGWQSRVPFQDGIHGVLKWSREYYGGKKT